MPGREARVVVFSYGGFVGEVVALLRKLGSTPVALVVPSNRPADATREARDAGSAAGLEILEQPPQGATDPFVQELARLEPDVLLIWSYSMILPAELIGVPRIGCVNVHGGLLPEYRGGHVLQWALLNGEPETGVTLHYVDEGIDSGPVIARRTFPIEYYDDAAVVASKLRAAGLAALREHWLAIVDGTAPAIPQTGVPTYWRLRRPEDSEIQWAAPAESVRNLVRALVPPWPGAYARLGDAILVVDRVEVAPGRPTVPPGTVTEVARDRFVVAATDASVVVLEARVDGAPMNPAAYGLAVGDLVGRHSDRYEPTYDDSWDRRS